MNIGISLYCQKNFIEKEVGRVLKNAHPIAIKQNEENLTNQIRNQVEVNWEKRKPGYRDGVVLVPIDIDAISYGLTCPIVELRDGMVLTGKFTSRVPNEEPRKKVSVPNVPSTPARFIDVVLYRKDVLAEGNENSGDYDWEVVTVLPKLHEEQPMPPDTLMYNHFKLSGGTDTKMDDATFVKALRESFVYWKDKAMVD